MSQDGWNFPGGSGNWFCLKKYKIDCGRPGFASVDHNNKLIKQKAIGKNKIHKRQTTTNNPHTHKGICLDMKQATMNHDSFSNYKMTVK